MATNEEIVKALRCDASSCDKDCAFYPCFDTDISNAAADLIEELEERIRHLEKASANLLIQNDMLKEDLEVLRDK